MRQKKIFNGAVLSNKEGTAFLINSVYFDPLTRTMFHDIIGSEILCLLYPMFRYEEAEPEFPYAVCESPDGNINIHFIRMPFIFEEDEEHTRMQLTDVIKKIFEIN